MIVEHFLATVGPGRGDDFEVALREALTVIESAPQCEGAEVRRQIEDPSVFLVLITWGSVEDHMAFRASPLFEQWRALTHPFYEGQTFPSVTHFSDVLAR